MRINRLALLSFIQVLLPCTMAQKITTLAYLPLAADASLDSALKIVKSLDGVGQVYYGRQLEDPDVVDLAVGILPIHITC